jgi:hypothetical protein
MQRMECNSNTIGFDEDIAIVVAQVLFIVSGGVKISKEAQGKKCCVCRKRSIQLCGCIK